MRAATGSLHGNFTDRYVIERELGRGASAIVYLARDRELSRLVAIKVLRTELLSEISSERFLREIQRTSELSHPNILPVLASGEHESLPYCVFPYMDEGTLRRRLDKEKQLPLADVVAIGARVARALAFAHSRNLVHRDVKPENVLFTAGQPVLADFGIARAVERALGDSTTSTGIVRGTPAYMSPEQAGAAQELDGRSDVYSLACVLYEAAAGVPAFIGATPQQLVSQRLLHMPRPLTVYRPAAPAALEKVLTKALAVAPADRYRDAGEFAQALESIDPGLLSGGNGGTTSRFVARLRSRRKLLVSSALAIIAVLALGVTLVESRKKPLADIPDGDPRRIAVLYFEDQTPATLPEYIADGITQDLIDQLSGVRALRVVSPAAVRRFRKGNATPDSIARALKVGTIVTGSVALSGRTMQLSVSMTDSAGRHFPVQQIRTARADLFSLQDSLARQVSFILRRRLGEVIDLRTYQAATRSSAAWELAQMGMDAMLRAEEPKFQPSERAAAAYLRADSLFARASILDPDWTLPLIRRGNLAIYIGDLSPRPPIAPPAVDAARYAAASVLEQRVAWSRRAAGLADDVLRKDKQSPQALWLRAESRFMLVKQRAPNADSLAALATPDFRAALALRPDYAKAWNSLGQLSRRAGRYAEAADEFQAAYDADAFVQVADIASYAFNANLEAGRFAEALKWCRLGLDRYPGDPRFTECPLVYLEWVGHTPSDAANALRMVGDLERNDTLGLTPARWSYRRLMVAAVLARAGMSDSARALMSIIRAHDEAPQTRRSPSLPDAYVELLLGNRERALAILTGWQRDAKNRSLGLHPWFTSLHGDPTFEALLPPNG